MLRKLLILLLIAIGSGAWAQETKTPVKSEDKKADEAIDYTLIGAPMPELNMKVFRDTASKEIAGAVLVKTGNNSDTTTGNKHIKRKKKDNNKRVHKSRRAKQKAYMTNEDFDKYTNLLVMMFNPNCSHCEDETIRLEKSISVFNNSKILLLANPLMWDYLPYFTKTMHVFDYPTLMVGSDSTFLNKLFLYQALPQINIYNKERKLIKTFTGEVGIDSLKKYLE